MYYLAQLSKFLAHVLHEHNLANILIFNLNGVRKVDLFVSIFGKLSDTSLFVQYALFRVWKAFKHLSRSSEFNSHGFMKDIERKRVSGIHFLLSKINKYISELIVKY